jgi:hypothetical protein
MREGGTVILSGTKGSGKTSICMKTKPTLFISTEQEIEEVAHSWYRIMGDSGEQTPLITNCYTWEQLREDLLGLDKGSRVIVDSISQFATGSESTEILQGIIESVREAGAIAWFIAQHTKDGSMLGPNMLAHMVDVVSKIPDDNLGMRRLIAEKNRFGSLFSTYFRLTGRGVEEQDFIYAYTVEGSVGNYRLHMYPMGGAKLGGVFDELVKNGVLIEGLASAAIKCAGYKSGFAEPEDIEMRRQFAIDHGLEWISPEQANQKIADHLEELGRPQEM